MKNLTVNTLDLTTKNVPDLITEFESDSSFGLSAKSAGQRLIQFGPNKLEAKSISAWQIFIRQFKSAFIYLILAALLITIILGEYLDSLMIFIFLTVNTTLGFIQEFRSEKVASFLSQFSLPRAHVVRDGKVEMFSSDGLVPGDIILLRTGDKIPADIRIIDQKNLMVNESILTGESISVYKNELTLDKPASALHSGFFRYGCTQWDCQGSGAGDRKKYHPGQDLQTGHGDQESE
jgi:magnesium-transporting ATPase (P-type)